MDYHGKKILVLEGYARQCLPYMRSFKKHGCDVTLLCNSKLDLGYVSRYADHKILGICDPERYEESRDYICNLIKTNQYDLVLPLVDFSARILSENKEELSQYAKIASNDAEVFAKSQDKLSVMHLCMENGIPCPRTLTEMDSLEDVVRENLTYPIVVKPRRGCGGKGFHRFDSEEELMSFEDTENLREYVVQEYIPQSDSNLSVNLFIDNDGVVKTAFTYVSRRWFPIKGGTGTLNELVDHPKAVEISKKLAEALQLRGFIGIDLIDDPRDQTPKVIEVNPRILACSKIGFDGGVDLAELILEKEFGETVLERNTYKTGIYVRMSQTDVLWFLKSPDRWKTKPSWFQIKNTKDQTFSWRDPLPWFAFLIRGLKRLDSEMEKRK